MLSGLGRMRFYNGKYRASSGLQQDTDIPAKKVFWRIRVNLDLDKGLLSFSDSDSNMHIQTYTHTFTERRFPFIASVKTFPLIIQLLKICKVTRVRHVVVFAGAHYLRIIETEEAVRGQFILLRLLMEKWAVTIYPNCFEVANENQ